MLELGQCFAILLVAILMLVSAWIFFRGSVASCRSNADLTGKTALITGANCGIGFYTALGLAKRNARVILACRNQEKAEQARSEIVAKSGNPNVAVGILDLSSLKSVRQFVQQINNDESRLDILVNNAGVGSNPKGREITEDGLEFIFATNHFGPFLLTNLLLDKLIASTPSRIVTVSSVVNKFGNIDFNNLQAEISYQNHKRYFDSKLANILFTRELAIRLEGKGVTANVLHPGTVGTELMRSLPVAAKFIVDMFMKTFGKTGEEGAQTSIYLAVAEEVKDVNGKYFSECALDEAGVNPISRDTHLARKLWEVSSQLTGLDV